MPFMQLWFLSFCFESLSFSFSFFSVLSVAWYHIFLPLLPCLSLSLLKAGNLFARFPKKQTVGQAEMGQCRWDVTVGWNPHSSRVLSLPLSFAPFSSPVALLHSFVSALSAWVVFFLFRPFLEDSAVFQHFFYANFELCIWIDPMERESKFQR